MTVTDYDSLIQRFILFGRRFAGHGAKGLKDVNEFLDEAGAGDEQLMGVLMRAYIHELLVLHEQGDLHW